MRCWDQHKWLLNSLNKYILYIRYFSKDYAVELLISAHTIYPGIKLYFKYVKFIQVSLDYGQRYLEITY